MAKLASDPARARRLLVSMAGERGPSLTEYAWAWILQEEDPAMLGLLLRLFCCEPGSDEGSRLRRALLESRVLAQAVLRMLNDEVTMAKAAALLGE